MLQPDVSTHLKPQMPIKLSYPRNDWIINAMKYAKKKSLGFLDAMVVFLHTPCFVASIPNICFVNLYSQLNCPSSLLSQIHIRNHSNIKLSFRYVSVHEKRFCWKISLLWGIFRNNMKQQAVAKEHPREELSCRPNRPSARPWSPEFRDSSGGFFAGAGILKRISWFIS